jgi:oxygen-dependent protoporphyrinogen oxidase
MNSALKRVVVVGAGIAGLSAAHRLAAAGCEVTVLEAGERVGGRMCSETVDGFLIDCGAQFLSSGYSVVPALAAVLGLGSRILPTSPWGAVWRDGRPFRVRADRPWTARALLGTGNLLRMGWHTLRRAPALTRLPLCDYSAWAPFDTALAAETVRRELGEVPLEYAIEPLLQGLYFQAPETCSQALSLAVSTFGVRACRNRTLAGGMGSLPAALAAGLNVHCRTAVERVEPGVVVAGARRWQADAVVLAAPANIARRLCAPAVLLAPHERRLLDTPYSSTIVIALMLRPGYALPAALSGVYGVLVPRRERQRIAAISLESRKCRQHPTGGELVNVMLADEAARPLLAADDAQVLAVVLPEVERYLPGAGAWLGGARLYRWPQAEPLSPPGRARDIAQYRRDALRDGRRLLLAGDYLSMPWTDGAAESGSWAAGALLRQRA